MTTEQLQQLITYMNEAKLKKEERLKTHIFIMKSILSEHPIDVEAYFMQGAVCHEIKEFMEQCGIEGKINAMDLYQLYESYCVKLGRKPENNTVFGREVKRLGYPCKHTHKAWVYEIGGINHADN